VCVGASVCVLSNCVLRALDAAQNQRLLPVTSCQLRIQNAAQPKKTRKIEENGENFNTCNKIRTKYAVKLNWKENRYGWHKQKRIEQNETKRKKVSKAIQTR